jgi:hypothetical protein
MMRRSAEFILDEVVPVLGLILLAALVLAYVGTVVLTACALVWEFHTATSNPLAYVVLLGLFVIELYVALLVVASLDS